MSRDCREADISNVAELASALEEGNTRRVVASHNMNEFSSRSHAVLSLYLEQRRKPNAPADPSKHKYLASKLNLVDLAGSVGNLILCKHHPSMQSCSLESNLPESCIDDGRFFNCSLAVFRKELRRQVQQGSSLLRA